MLPGFDGEVLLVACACAVSCAVPGTWLFLAKRSMHIEAVSHAVLFGIVLVFLLGQGGSIVLMFAGALTSAFFAISSSAFLERKLRHYRDASPAVVFPTLFALAVAILNTQLKNSHIDTQVVLMGELALVSFDRFQWNGYDLGPQALWKCFVSILATGLLLSCSAKDLLGMFFDLTLARVMGTRVRLLSFAFIACTCFAAVCAVDVVGSVLTLGLFALPATSARLVTSCVKSLVLVAVFFSLFGTVLGYFLGLWLDVSLAGSICLGQSVPLISSLVFAALKRRLKEKTTKQFVC